MEELTDKQHRDLRQAAKIASSMPEIEYEINGMEKTVLNTVFGLIRKGALTPDQAMSYWMEIYSYHRLLKRFETTLQTASTVTETRSTTNG